MDTDPQASQINWRTKNMLPGEFEDFCLDAQYELREIMDKELVFGQTKELVEASLRRWARKFMEDLGG